MGVAKQNRLTVLVWPLPHHPRHCEERSDEAIHLSCRPHYSMIASSAIMLVSFTEGDSRFRRAQVSAPQTIAL
jgi:hypothetical protein